MNKTLKYRFFLNTLKTHCKYTIATQKLLLPFICLNFYTQKNSVKIRFKKNYDKTPYVWSTKFTPVQKKFTQPLVVMVETFRISGDTSC